MKQNYRKMAALLMILTLSCGMLFGCQSDPSSSSSSKTSEDRERIEERELNSDGDITVNSNGETVTQSSQSASSNGGSGATTGKNTTGTQKPGVSTTTSQATSSSAITNGTYPPLGNSVMPIAAWVAPPRAGVKNNNPSFINDAQYKMLQESGINMIYGLYETATDDLPEVKKSLDLCAKYGLKYLVRDSNTNEPDEALMRKTLENYATHPAFAGVKVQDEPGVNTFDRFGEMHPIFNKLLPDKYFYINLMPSYATPSQLQFGAATTRTDGNTTFSAYLKSYIEKVKPAFLSYDYYPITGAAGTVQNGYFNELSTFRALGQQYNIPYWVFIQACSYGGNTRRPNEAELLWQVNTALSYGAKGIQYFCYFTPLEDDVFKGSFIDKNGQKTEIYAYGQKANKQIAAVGSVLLNSTSKGVMVTGQSPDDSIPDGDVLTQYGVLTSITHTGAPFITGCFSNGGKDAYYVTNNSIKEGGTATLQFNKSVSGNKVIGGVNSSFSGSSITLTLNAGEGALIYL